jgi:hypothetical protein
MLQYCGCFNVPNFLTVPLPSCLSGGRFDLRLPHVEIGYTDESADVMGKLGRWFGFGKKKQDEKDK